MSRPSNMRALMLVAAMAATPASAQVVSGNITYTATVDSATAIAPNLVDLGSSSSTGLVSQGAVNFQVGDGSTGRITFSGQAGVYHGASGNAVAPQLAGTTIAANYLAAQPFGAVTITYSAPQTYFGINWGSVDSYNSLQFYNNGVAVASLTGAQVLSSAGFGFTSANVAVNFATGTQFTSVIARSTSPAFEFGLLRSAPRVAPSPLTGSTPLGTLVAGLMLWHLARSRNRRAK
jgi:hypothetical protein